MEGLSELLSFQWASDGGPASIQAALRLALAILLSAAVGIDRELKHSRSACAPTCWWRWARRASA